jgi:hypothetical protein
MTEFRPELRQLKILMDLADDWGSLLGIVGLVRESLFGTGDKTSVRDETLFVIYELIENGWIRAGDIEKRFRPLGLSPQETLVEIQRRWADPVQVDEGWVDCWFDITDQGVEVLLSQTDTDLADLRVEDPKGYREYIRGVRRKSKELDRAAGMVTES